MTVADVQKVVAHCPPRLLKVARFQTIHKPDMLLDRRITVWAQRGIKHQTAVGMGVDPLDQIDQKTVPSGLGQCGMKQMVLVDVFFKISRAIHPKILLLAGDRFPQQADQVRSHFVLEMLDHQKLQR